MVKYPELFTCCLYLSLIQIITDLLVLFATLFTGCHEILVDIWFPFISHL